MGKKSKKPLSRLRLYLTVLLLDLIVGGIWYYFSFPALNIHYQTFWLILIVIFTVDTVIISLAQLTNGASGKDIIHFAASKAKFVLVIDLILIGIVIVGNILGLKILRSKDYASLLNVKECEFTEDIKESDSVSNIALMDTDSARIFGNREIGSLSDVVSQYEVSGNYNQINVSSTPMKVSALKYASFFKWIKNRSNGVPGYVQVNAVNSDAEYVKVKSGMKYVPSGYFNDNLMRHVQFKNPTRIISGYYFEVDDEGNPYYICPCLSAKIGLFDGMDVVGAVICNPVNGECKYYKVKDIPKWVDHVYDGELCTKKYDWHGILSKGFFNSIISQTGCKKTTEDFGYIALNDDVWVYTGVTSLNSDQSNVGFIMVNQRTSEAKYYKVSGAEEFSAMKSAEGAVQEKKYTASFPSLINVKGQPTYIMVLKDSGGLVKMYAMVNVQQYNIVATGSTQSEAFSNYKKMLAKGGIKGNSSSNIETKITITVSDIQFINKEDDTIVYVKSTTGDVFKQSFLDNEELILLNKGDVIEVTSPDYEDSQTENGEEQNQGNKIYTMTSFLLKETLTESSQQESTSTESLQQETTTQAESSQQEITTESLQ